MNKYQGLQQKALGLAFILAPLLLVMGSAAVVMGIGLTPFEHNSWVDGIFMAYGFLLMIPVSFELARILGQRSPVFGLTCAIIGLGWGMSIIAGALRLVQMVMVNADLNESIWTAMDSTPASLAIMLPSLVGILSLLLLGIGLLWKGGIPRWSAGLIIVGSAIFFISVLIPMESMESIISPVANVAFLVALAPIGLRYLKGGSQEVELGVVPA